MSLENPNSGAMKEAYEGLLVDKIGLPETFVDKARAAVDALSIFQAWESESFLQGIKFAEDQSMYDDFCTAEKKTELAKKDFHKAASELVDAIRHLAFMEKLKDKLRQCETDRMAKFKETAERIAAQNARHGKCQTPLIAGREEDDSD